MCFWSGECSRLGGKATLAGVCGDDGHAGTLRDLLGAAEIEFELLSVAERLTTVKLQAAQHRSKAPLRVLFVHKAGDTGYSTH